MPWAKAKYLDTEKDPGSLGYARDDTRNVRDDTKQQRRKTTQILARISSQRVSLKSEDEPVPMVPVVAEGRREPLRADYSNRPRSGRRSDLLFWNLVARRIREAAARLIRNGPARRGPRRWPEADWKNPGGERISAMLPNWTLALQFGFISGNLGTRL